MKKKRKSFSFSQPDFNMRMEKLNNLPLIEKWMVQRKDIADVYFADDAETIYLKKKGEETYTLAQVFYIKNDSPRVSRVKLASGKVLSGYKLPTITKKSLIEGFKSDSKSPEKIKYINAVAEKAIKNGYAVFDMKKYFGLSSEELQNRFKKRELQAFIESLASDFEVAEIKEFKIKVKMLESI